MNKQELLQSFDRIYCRLKPSDHGIGVFAIRDIPEGINPFLDCYMGEFIEVSPDELKDQPEAIRTMINDFCPLQDGVYQVPECGMAAIDLSFYLNHSKEPNMRADKEGLDFYTNREIKEGEELTVDYETYDDIGL